MAEEFHHRFADILGQPPFDKELAGQKNLALALSGGPDSMALCRLLSAWADNQENDITIHALTVDHGLRPESAGEAQQAGLWVKDWPHVRHQVLKAQESISGKRRVMEEARRLRYRLMADYCGANGIRKLFLAHHQDDQAETFLFRLAKGSGLDGLTAMRVIQPLDDKLTLLRPLLDVPKENLVIFCSLMNVPFIDDPTNQNPRFARNRLRGAHEILAREGLTAKRLSVTAGRMARAREALDFYAQAALEKAREVQESGKISLNWQVLANEPAETGLRVLMLAMEEISLPGNNDEYGPRLQKLETLAADIFNETIPFKRRTLGGFIFSRNIKKNLVTIERES